MTDNDPSPPGRSATGKRCVAYGCSKCNRDGVSLHVFPVKNIDICRQWINFVKRRRKKWDGPTKHSVLCSDHFLETCYPVKYKIMESVGQTIKRKDLLGNAVPTVHTVAEETAECTPPATKKIRMAFTKRENARILFQHEQGTQPQLEPELMETDVSGSTSQGSGPCESVSTNQDDRGPVVLSSPHQTTSRSYGCQISLKKPKRSAKTQTPPPSNHKVCQTTAVKYRSVEVQCNLIGAPLAAKDRQEEACYEDCMSVTDQVDDDEDLIDDKFDLSFNASFSSDGSEDSDGFIEDDCENTKGEEKKFIVYQSELMKLFETCPRCCGPTLGDIYQTLGTAVKVKQECGVCQFTNIWKSQPMIRSIPAGNLALSSSILFSGSLPSKVLRMLRFLNIQAISYDTFLRHQRFFIQPAILKVWKNQQELYFDNVIESGKSVVLGGDGRADTPGHSAKYGSYTLMDLDEGKVIDLQLVQSNEVRNSCNMEKEGLIRSVGVVQDKGVEIAKLVTDRHVQVLKWVRENLPSTKHCVDVWHVAKGLKKKLTAASKEKECENLVPWIKSISNHLYWVAASTPSADPCMMLEKWLSVLNHIQNKHEGHGQLFLKCCHEDLTGRERRKKWFSPGTKVCQRVEDIVTSRQMKKDIPMLSTNQQTSSLESFHSVINHFAPKMIGFSYHGMMCRLMLAALHFNENSGRNQATDQDGILRYRVEFPKYKKGDHIVRQVKVDCTYEYVNTLLSTTKDLVENPDGNRCEELPASPPSLCLNFVHPDKNDAVAGFKSRFSKS